MTFAERVIDFNKNLVYTGGKLPDGIRIMNPFREHEFTMDVSSQFYRKYYNDDNKRHIILGINPGRFGGGITGVPFTDPKRLADECGIQHTMKRAHEPSSVFVYEVIKAYGGIEQFYNKFYINSVCPLGFVKVDNKGKEKNYNYYDSRELTEAAYPFIIESIKKQIGLGVYTDVAFCFGNGANERFLRKINEEHHFFERIVGLEHPRFVIQYHLKRMQFYIEKYVNAFHSIEQ